jgi:hypothetical protein
VEEVNVEEVYKDTPDHIDIIRNLPKREEVFVNIENRLSGPTNYKYLALLYNSMNGEETVEAFQLTRDTFREKYGEDFEAAEKVAAAGPTGGRGQDKARDAVMSTRSDTWVRGITWMFNSLTDFVQDKPEFRYFSSPSAHLPPPLPFLPTHLSPPSCPCPSPSPPPAPPLPSFNPSPLTVSPQPSPPSRCLDWYSATADELDVVIGHWWLWLAPQEGGSSLGGTRFTVTTLKNLKTKLQNVLHHMLKRKDIDLTSPAMTFATNMYHTKRNRTAEEPMAGVEGDRERKAMGEEDKERLDVWMLQHQV